jgi:hypothetical protein
MKGDLFWLIFSIFIALIVTIVIALWQGQTILGTADQAIKLSAKYKAVQVAGAVNGLQGAPEGTVHRLGLPEGGPGCISFTANSVAVSLGRASSIGLIEAAVGDAGIKVTESIDCSRHSKLIIEKKADFIEIRPV